MRRSRLALRWRVFAPVVVMCLFALAPCLSPPPARAASVDPSFFWDTLLEGEVNSVTAVRIGDSFEITDTTATLFPTSFECMVDASGHVATCPVRTDPSAPPFAFNLGPHDDTLTNQAADVGITISGQAGDDTLIGGAGAEAIDGGVGDDDIHAGDGDDFIFDGPDDDLVEGGSGRDNLQAGDGADDLFGGPGPDTAYYGGRLDPVEVTLDGQPNDGEEEELDNVAGDVESVTGGVDDDRLIGNDANNDLLAGNTGNDVIAGAGGADGLNGEEGNDVLDGGTGPDTVSGQDGNDQITARDGERDTIRCGVGTDSVLADYNDSVSVDCEVVDRSPGPPPPPEPDLTEPVIRGLAVSPRSFLAARSGDSIAAAAGTRVSYRLSEPAVTRFRVMRAARGRRVANRCVAPTRRNRRARPCTRYLALRGAFRHTGLTGPNSFRFTGRLARKKLPPGRYRLEATATDTAGNLSESIESPFGIRPPRG